MKKKMKKGLFSFGLIVVLLSLVLGGVVFVHYVSKLSEEVFVQKLGIAQTSFTELGCNDFTCVSAKLEKYAEDFLAMEYTWTSERGDLTLTFEEMGASVDTDKLARTVENFMIGTDDFEKSIVFLFGGDLVFDLKIDTDKFKAAFLEGGIEQGIKNATYIYSSGLVSIQPEQIGYGIDTDKVEEILQEAWSNANLVVESSAADTEETVEENSVADSMRVPTLQALPLHTSEPEFLTADLDLLLEDAQEISIYFIELQGEWGASWDLVFADYMDWFLPAQFAGETVAQKDEQSSEQNLENAEQNNDEQNKKAKSNFMFTIDPIAFEKYLKAELVETVEEEAQSVSILEDDEGNYDFEGSARFGKLILREEMMAAIISLLESKYNEENEIQEGAAASVKNETVMELLIPLETVTPEVTVPDSLREKGVTDLLEFGYTGFSGSPYNRILNVNHGMEIYNGHILEQGEEFSFTTLLGPVDGAHGWKKELVIVGDETKPEYGGGLCQVSSTMYRAALYSGLEITMRKEHSYAVSYYAYPNGYGLDATIYQPYPDLRFINNTDGAILIQGYTDGALAYFVFYGTNDGRSVQMEGPINYGYTAPGAPVVTYTDELESGVRELKEHAHTGFQVDWYRTITAGDGTVGERENIHTYYEARPEKWLEGRSAEDEDEATASTEED